MPTVTDHPARGKVSAASNGTVVFRPAGTTYELHLALPDGGAAAPAEGLTQGVIRAKARKVWTVPSGGNFIVPIFGPPRIIQGRVRFVDGGTIVVQAGTPVVVELPADNAAIDLARGPIVVGSMVNVTTMPGATFEPIGTGR